MMAMYPQTHINWSKCDNWNAARRTLRELFPTTPLYGNFADLDASPDEAKAALHHAGFVVWQNHTDPNDLRLSEAA